MEILTTVLLGLCIVFLGLIFICLLIMGTKKIMSLKIKLKKNETEEIVEPEEKEDDSVLIAILTAAIAAYTPESKKKFRVVSFRPRTGSSH